MFSNCRSYDPLSYARHLESRQLEARQPKNGLDPALPSSVAYPNSAHQPAGHFSVPRDRLPRAQLPLPTLEAEHSDDAGTRKEPAASKTTTLANTGKGRRKKKPGPINTTRPSKRLRENDSPSTVGNSGGKNGSLGAETSRSLPGQSITGSGPRMTQDRADIEDLVTPRDGAPSEAGPYGTERPAQDPRQVRSNAPGSPRQIGVTNDGTAHGEAHSDISRPPAASAQTPARRKFVWPSSSNVASRARSPERLLEHSPGNLPQSESASRARSPEDTPQKLPQPYKWRGAAIQVNQEHQRARNTNGHPRHIQPGSHVQHQNHRKQGHVPADKPADKPHVKSPGPVKRKPRHDHARPTCTTDHDEGIGDIRHCYYCHERLPLDIHYRCCHCSIELCGKCYKNVSLIHPGHAFRVAQAAQVQDLPAQLPLTQQPPVQCNTCSCTLSGLWYECEDCSDCVYSCAGCRASHISGHTFCTIRATAVEPEAAEGAVQTGERHDGELASSDAAAVDDVGIDSGDNEVVDPGPQPGVVDITHDSTAGALTHLASFFLLPLRRDHRRAPLPVRRLFRSRNTTMSWLSSG